MQKPKSESSEKDVIFAAIECACQILDISLGTLHFPDRSRHRPGDIPVQFHIIQDLHYNLRMHHPSDYIRQYITDSFTDDMMNLALVIISDSYLSLCCLVYTPDVIAEGAAIMSSAMFGRADAVIPKTTKSLSFVRDMKAFYEESYK